VLTTSVPGQRPGAGVDVQPDAVPSRPGQSRIYPAAATQGCRREASRRPGQASCGAVAAPLENRPHRRASLLATLDTYPALVTCPPHGPGAPAVAQAGDMHARTGLSYGPHHPAVPHDGYRRTATCLPYGSPHPAVPHDGYRRTATCPPYGSPHPAVPQHAYQQPITVCGTAQDRGPYRRPVFRAPALRHGPCSAAHQAEQPSRTPRPTGCDSARPTAIRKPSEVRPTPDSHTSDVGQPAGDTAHPREPYPRTAANTRTPACSTAHAHEPYPSTATNTRTPACSTAHAREPYPRTAIGRWPPAGP
jgi:hypothetical protein